MLTDEHVIPRGIGGKLIIGNASCEKCRLITHRFETAVMQKMLLASRIHIGFKSKNPKGRPNHLPVHVVRDGKMKTDSVPICDHPGLMILPIFPSPGLYSGYGPTRHHSAFRVVVSDHHSDFRERLRKVGRGAENVLLEVSRKYHPDYMLMLLKIAHCHSILRFGINAFDPILPKLMYDEASALSWYVGSKHPVKIVQTERAIHRIECEYPIIHGMKHLVCNIQLFGRQAGPVHKVITGIKHF